MRKIGILVLISLLHYSLSSYAKLQMPRQMNGTDRKLALQIIGPGTSNRLLSSPYPLGGGEGFEISISRHYVPTAYLSELGDKSAPQGDLNFPLLTFGKGLYYNIDLFLSIVPMIQTDSFNHFSSQLRYEFWQSENQIFRFSGMLYAGTSTLNNQLNLQSYGFDLLGTTTIDRVSLFAGFGLSLNKGRFIGGIKGITDTQDSETESINLMHQLIGLEWPIANFFWAAEVDRFKIPYYSFKIGYRI